METNASDGATQAPGYCQAAHILSTISPEATPCEGPQDAVLLLSSVEIPTERMRNLLGTRACVHHGATLYAHLAYARVYPNGETHGGAAIEVYRRAQQMAQTHADAAVVDAQRYLGGMAA